jgi:hypothetical protein
VTQEKVTQEKRSGGCTRVGRGPVSARAGRTRFRDDGADGAIEVGARRSSMRRVTFQAGEMSFFPRHTERRVGAGDQEHLLLHISDTALMAACDGIPDAAVGTGSIV